MFSLALLIGVYSYIIFTLGILGLIYKPIVFLVSTVYLLTCVYYFRTSLANFSNFVKHKKKFLVKINRKNLISALTKDKFAYLLLFLLSLQAFVNLIGVFAPEISFDALWYHLTLPKIYILQHTIIHIPGNLLYYSDMPKLTEMLYTSAMILTNEYFAKFISFLFGILTIAAIYGLSRKYFSKSLSLLSSVIFYSCLVVGWESITAYVDLTRTFFEIMAFWGFINWTEKNGKKWIIISGVMLGFAATVKLVAYGSLIVFLILFMYESYLKNSKFSVFIKNFTLFFLFSLLIPVPWFIFSFLNTGNPLYPYFTNAVVDSGKTFVFPNASFILKDLYAFFLNLNDPISPVYLIVTPLVIVNFKKYSKWAKKFLIYVFTAIAIWYIALENRGGRFILPYLPVFSILSVYAIKQLAGKYLYTVLVLVIILISVISIAYRGVANAKFAPFILGRETKSDFLNKHLNFSFGDFYDTDNYFKNNIKPTDRILLFGFHNLYYVNFPFIDSSWVKKGDKFNFIAVQNSKLPEKFNDWQEIYYNPVTGVKLYSLKGKQWAY